jgi:hypothetical protein
MPVERALLPLSSRACGTMKNKSRGGPKSRAEPQSERPALSISASSIQASVEPFDGAQDRRVERVIGGSAARLRLATEWQKQGGRSTNAPPVRDVICYLLSAICYSIASFRRAIAVGRECASIGQKCGLMSGRKSNSKRNLHGCPYFGCCCDDYYRRALFRAEPDKACLACAVHSFSTSVTPGINRIPYAWDLN